MIAAGLLDKLRGLAVEVTAEGGEIVLRGCVSAISPDLRAALRTAKPALLRELEAEALMVEYGLGRCRQCRRILTTNHLAALSPHGLESGGAQYECLDRLDCREFTKTLLPTGNTAKTIETAAPISPIGEPAGQGLLGDWQGD